MAGSVTHPKSPRRSTSTVSSPISMRPPSQAPSSTPRWTTYSRRGGHYRGRIPMTSPRSENTLTQYHSRSRSRRWPRNRRYTGSVWPRSGRSGIVMHSSPTPHTTYTPSTMPQAGSRVLSNTARTWPGSRIGTSTRSYPSHSSPTHHRPSSDARSWPRRTSPSSTTRTSARPMRR